MPGQVDSRRCIICSYKKRDSTELSQYPMPLCHWCAGQNLADTLHALREEVVEQTRSEPLLDCTRNDLFHFLSDLGEFAASHPHLNMIRDIISTLLMNVGGQNRMDYHTLLAKLPSNLRARVVMCLLYLRDMGLVDLETTITDEGYTHIDGIGLPPDGILRKALTTLESSSKWEERREPNLVLSYILVVGLAETIDLIEDQGFLEVGQGVTRLYVVKGQIRIPKQFTAPLAFILGNWAREVDEFSQDNIAAFLALRGFSQRDRNRIMQFIAGVHIGLSHSIYRSERHPNGDGTHSYRFVLNPEYKILRERLRTRTRASRS